MQPGQGASSDQEEFLTWPGERIREPRGATSSVDVDLGRPGYEIEVV